MSVAGGKEEHIPSLDLEGEGRNKSEFCSEVIHFLSAQDSFSYPV